MRFVPSQTPLATPYLSMASRVYCEHVGMNRHDGGNTSEIVVWYSLIDRRANPLTGLSDIQTPRPSSLGPPARFSWDCTFSILALTNTLFTAESRER
jgi:hypothetical protein